MASAGRDRHRVARDRRAVAARRPGHQLAPRHHRAQRHARGDPLGQQRSVGHHAGVLGGEHLAGPPHAALHLVEHQQDAVPVADRAQPREEVGAAARCSRLRPARARRRSPRRRRAARPSRTAPRRCRRRRRSRGTRWAAAGRSPRRYFALLAVSDSDPSVRPWKPPRNAISPGRRVWWRDSLIAASTASVPELVRNVCQWWALGPIALRASCAELLADRAVARVVEVGAADVNQHLAPAPQSPPRPPGGSGRSTPSPRPPRRRGRRCRRRPRPCSPTRAAPSAGNSGSATATGGAAARAIISWARGPGGSVTIVIGCAASVGQRQSGSRLRGRRWSRAHRPALLAQVAGQGVVAADVLPRRAAALPAAEGLHAGPGAGGRAGGAVDVDDARLDALEEGVDLAPARARTARRSARTWCRWRAPAPRPGWRPAGRRRWGRTALAHQLVIARQAGQHGRAHEVAVRQLAVGAATRAAGPHDVGPGRARQRPRSAGSPRSSPAWRRARRTSPLSSGSPRRDVVGHACASLPGSRRRPSR